MSHSAKKLKHYLHQQHTKPAKPHPKHDPFTDFYLHYLTDPNIFTAVNASLPPDVFNCARLLNLAKLYIDGTLTPPHSRIALSDAPTNALSLFTGILSDIKIHNDHQASLLLSFPLMHTPHNNQARLIDSHLWIQTDNILSTQTDDLTLALGDIIHFYAQPYHYSGKVQTSDCRTLKYSLTNIIIHQYGVNVHTTKTPDNALRLRHDFPLYHDWVVKITPGFTFAQTLWQEFADQNQQQLTKRQATLLKQAYQFPRFKFQASHYGNFVTQIRQTQANGNLKEQKSLRQALAHAIHQALVALHIPHSPINMNDLILDFKHIQSTTQH